MHLLGEVLQPLTSYFSGFLRSGWDFHIYG